MCAMKNATFPGATHQPSDRGAIIEDFRSFVAAQSFPCVGAKSALASRIASSLKFAIGSDRMKARTFFETAWRVSLPGHPDPGE